jgi:phospholipid/cholesterol/gamma-HCH transport system ATP-binding protein
MILFEQVHFSYGTRPVLREFSFSIQQNEKVAILGGSGEGKTTILRLILGLLKPDAGRILIDGTDISDQPEDRLNDIRKNFSVVFQEGALFDSLSVKENVAFGLREYTRMTEEALDDKVREMLRMVGLEDALELMPEELSGGMNRRVAMIRSLAAFEPKMFLYDEPTTGLDPVNADVICQLILNLSGGGKGFLVITHKIYDAMRLASRFMFLKNASIIFDGKKEELIRSPIPEIQIYLRELGLGTWSPLRQAGGSDV